LGYAGVTSPIADCFWCKHSSGDGDQSAIGNWKSADDVADLARFERATSTFARSRSNSAELQVQSISDCQLPIADLQGKVDPSIEANRQLAVGNRQ
jgi:hypothetical protein